MYITNAEENDCIILIVWVNDLIIASFKLSLINNLKWELASVFKMKDLGTLSNFLGIDFEISEGCINMHQTRYMKRILNRFNMSDCHPKSLPCPMGSNTVNNESQPLCDQKIYQEIRWEFSVCNDMLHS